MKRKLDQKEYRTLIAILIFLSVLCLGSMLLVGLDNFAYAVPLSISAMVFFALIILWAILFMPSTVAYEKRVLYNKLARRDFQEEPVPITRENVGSFLLTNGYKPLAQHPAIYQKKVLDNYGDGAVDRRYRIVISEYREGMPLDADDSDPSAAHAICLRILFADDVREDLLEAIKQYELAAFEKRRKRILHPYAYHPVFLICRGKVYALHFDKASSRAFLRLYAKHS